MTSWAKRPVLVTGGAGLIGHRVVHKLVELEADITVLDDLSKGAVSNLRPVLDKVRFIKGDLAEKKTAEEILQNTEVCFHLAARIGGIGYFHKAAADILAQNSLMNLNLWEAARSTDTRMVCLSSSMVFERTKIFPTPESAINNSPPPKTGYGFSKLMAEYIAKAYYEQYGVNYLIARPFNAYGPGETPGDYVGYSHVIPDLVQKIMSGNLPLEIFGSGKQVRSYTYVDDLADALIFISEKSMNDDFNIGTGRATTVSELAHMIWRLCGGKGRLKIKKVRGYDDDVQIRIPDVSKILALGWRPKISLEEGLNLTVEWLRTRVISRRRLVE